SFGDLGFGDVRGCGSGRIGIRFAEPVSGQRRSDDRGVIPAWGRPSFGERPAPFSSPSFPRRAGRHSTSTRSGRSRKS
ncbi:hypothetical protein, partial [Azospirillum sp. B506]|uniref:hypothetical protein n=1 Tax=Azospirillum sp. B506 TaxID=137721 RepID=UPI0005B2868B